MSRWAERGAAAAGALAAGSGLGGLALMEVSGTELLGSNSATSAALAVGYGLAGGWVARVRPRNPVG